METKRCKYCHEDLPLTEEYFYFSKNRFDNRCKICRQILNLINREERSRQNRDRYLANKEDIKLQRQFFYEENREYILEQKKGYHKRNKEKKRIYRLEKNFGIKEAELQEMLNEQRGCCAICGETLVVPESIRSYMVDHNHNTGRVRGLLCNYCNSILGLSKDKIEILKSAIKYLEKDNAINSDTV